MRPSAFVTATLLAALPTGVAVADTDDISRKLTNYEAEARSVGTNLPPLNPLSGIAGQRRLVDAQVAFTLGDYDAAALALFDLAREQGRIREGASAMYYLAEALFQKGDRGAARGYFSELVKTMGAQGRYYQPSLQRLIEIAIAGRRKICIASG